MTENANKKLYYTTAGVCKALKIARSTLLRWHKTDRLVPDYVHPHTGYRYYSVERIEKLNMIQKRL